MYMHNYSGAEIIGKQTDSLSEKNKMTCSIVGARGYSGLELARLLLNHPQVQLTKCFATSEFKLSDYLTNPKACTVECLKDSEILNNLTDVVFLATPAEVSLQLAPLIIARGHKVIDLSGAFRLKTNDYKKWYGFNHTENKALVGSHYGLTAWSTAAKDQLLIANPGCYATAISLALIPVLKNDLINKDQIVIDAKSGTSGGGKKASDHLLFTEVESECLPYKVGKHQHYPEIIETIRQFTGLTIDAHMTTSLLPVRRGIIAGIYTALKPGKTIQDIKAAYEAAYGQNNLITFGSLNENPTLLSLKKVVGTAKTHISYEVNENKVYIFSCIDNLIKGAAGQAIENLNQMGGLSLDTGLTHLEGLI